MKISDRFTGEQLKVIVDSDSAIPDCTVVNVLADVQPYAFASSDDYLPGGTPSAYNKLFELIYMMNCPDKAKNVVSLQVKPTANMSETKVTV